VDATKQLTDHLGNARTKRNQKLEALLGMVSTRNGLFKQTVTLTNLCMLFPLMCYLCVALFHI